KTILFVIKEVISLFDSMISGGIWEIPFRIDAIMIIVPAKYENTLMNAEGLGFDNVERDLSISNALNMNAAPRILMPSANASLEKPNIIDNPLVTNSAPGRPKKNFEYLGS